MKNVTKVLQSIRNSYYNCNHNREAYDEDDEDNVKADEEGNEGVAIDS